MEAAEFAGLVTGFQPVLGAAILLRPLRTDDTDIEEAFLRGLSSETRSSRLLGGARKITPEYVARLTQVNDPQELALAAVTVLEGRETLIGVARYALEPDGGCEFAIVIADAWQGHGIGTRLLRHLIDAARVRGVARVTGLVLSTNAGMLRFARALGFSARREPDDATLTRVTLALAARH